MQVELSYPVKMDGTELRVLQLRRPKVRDLIVAAKLGGSDEDKEVRVFANLCEVTPETIEELDISDYKKLQDAYQSFFGKAPRK